MIELGSGHYPEWDEDHPLHFVGHSSGAQVVRVLQQMLADKVCFFSFQESMITESIDFPSIRFNSGGKPFQAFRGYEGTSENWVLSLTSLSGAFNGTTRAYFDGMQ